MVQRDPEIRNAARREYVAQQGKKAKAKAKLQRRLAQKKAEKDDPELRRQRIATNVPRTIENTREWIGGPVVDEKQQDAKSGSSSSDDDDDDDGMSSEDGMEEDDEDQPEVQDREEIKAQKYPAGKSAAENEDQGDARTRPVQIKSGSNPEEFELDMAGLEDLFVDHSQSNAPEASTSQLPPPHKPILLTTSPRPHGPTYDFLNELQSLLGGKKHAHIVPRKNARFELSKVCKWAIKRGYGGIAVVGEDYHGEPATVTISLLPYGPCAHFRLTSVISHKQISNHANPTAHIPELVLSNFSTPLGLSIGRLLQSVFPPLPQIIGRQVVAVHNQRDYIFLRRFRYMFALRETEMSKKVAKERGMDEDVRTKMQEIGPRFTLKLRWLKRGPLGEGRRRGPNGETTASHQEAQMLPELEKGAEAAEDLTEQEKQEEQDAENEMLAQLGQDAVTDPTGIVGAKNASTTSSTTTPAATSSSNGITTGDATATKRKRASKKSLNKRPRTMSPGGSVHIPKINIPTNDKIDRTEHPHMRKIKKNASVLDSLPVTLGLGRGGTRKKNLEWEWDPRMNVSRRRFAL